MGICLEIGIREVENERMFRRIFTKEFDGEHYVKAEHYTGLIDLLLEEKKKNEKLSGKLEMLRTRCRIGVENDFDKGNYDKLQIVGNTDNTTIEAIEHDRKCLEGNLKAAYEEVARLKKNQRTRNRIIDQGRFAENKKQ